jgi:uncharacterized protein involved in exopolysaccharide biosynthesis
MSQKALDVFFRHKLIIILPFLLLIAAGALFATTQEDSDYESQAKVWTQRTPLLSSQLGGDDSFSSPASSQARVLNELLSLRSFRLAVAMRISSLSGLTIDEQVDAVRNGTAVYSSGNHIMTVQNKNEDPQLAQEIISAIILTYSERFQETVSAEAEAASLFYEERLATARADLDAAKTDLVTYQQASGIDPNSGASDPELTSLTVRVDRAESDYADALDRLQEIYLQRDAALTGRDLGFQVMDPPSFPTSSVTTPKRDLLMLPVLGGLLGIAASVAVLFALVRMDGSVRLPFEAARSGLPVLAVVPNLGRKRRRSWPQNFVRQAVGISRGLVSGSG